MHDASKLGGRRWVVWTALPAAALLLGATSAGRFAQAENPPVKAAASAGIDEGRIAGLIEQLGGSLFKDRQQAQAELLRLQS